MLRYTRTFAILLCVILLSSSANAAKNVILIIGDGMGYGHVKAGSYYLTGASGGLCFEKYYKCGVITDSLSTDAATDSAAGATAIATGHKTNNGVLSQSPTGEEYPTILEQAKAMGKSTGLVTTDTITGATPAAFGCHEDSRSKSTGICDDYLNSSLPDVIFGGGDPNRGKANITKEQLAKAQELGYKVIFDINAMSALNPKSTNRVVGLFTGPVMTYESVRSASCTEPHLSQMTAKALSILSTDPDGFFLMIESACIDKCSHKHNIDGATYEVAELNNTVKAVLNWMADRNDTLLIVTADHETGGLAVKSAGSGSVPTAAWGVSDHSRANVPLYTTGADANLFDGYTKNGVIDNTDIYRVMSAALKVKITPPAKP